VQQPKPLRRLISGWVILDKPASLSSTQAVGRIKYLFNVKKAGHAGTLDPLATGVLPIALGEATKTVPFVQAGRKSYEFDIVWGTETTTDDAEGEVTAASGHRPTEIEVEAALSLFTGLIEQVPPAFSAIKINGERAYDLARAGEKMELEPRAVEIDRFELIDHAPDKSRFIVDCAKGTYVRSLARDLARKLATHGHAGHLRRTRTGIFTIADAVSLDQIEAADPDGRDAFLRPVATGLRDVPEIRVDTGQAGIIRRGNPVLLTGAGAPIALVDAWASLKGEVVALGYVEKGQFKPRRVILASGG
jgi:tRNA pseudouridine55 synthase